MRQMSKKLKNFEKFEVRKLKNVEIGDKLTDVKFVMGIFGRISEYRYHRYFCKSIGTISIPIFVDTSHHYSFQFLLFIFSAYVYLNKVALYTYISRVLYIPSPSTQLNIRHYLMQLTVLTITARLCTQATGTETSRASK